MSLPFSRSGARIKFGYGVMRSLIKRLIVSASVCALAKPITFLSLSMPKKRVPPIPFAKALRLLSQLFGFFTSRATLKSHSVASAIHLSIINSFPFPSFLLFLRSALIHIILILTLRAAEDRTRSACHKRLRTMSAKAHRLFAVGQHIAEHHLYAEQHRVEIPYNRRLIKQSDMICGSNAAEGCHTLLHHQPCFLVQMVVILIVQHTCGKVKCPIGKLLLHPLIAFGILTLKAHIDRHRLVAHSHGKRHHHTVILYVPHGFNATLDHSGLFKRKEQIEIVLGGHSFLSDKMVFRQIYRLIFHKVRCSRQSRHQAKQTVFHSKLLNCFLYLGIRLLAHTHSPDIDGIQDNPLILAQRVVNARMCRFGGRKVQCSVLRRFPFIFTISHPVGTGTFKQVFHRQNPPLYIVTRIIRNYITIILLFRGFFNIHSIFFQKFFFKQGQGLLCLHFFGKCGKQLFPYLFKHRIPYLADIAV